MTESDLFLYKYLSRKVLIELNFFFYILKGLLLT